MLMIRKILALCCLLSVVAPSIASAGWDDPPSTSICDDPAYYGTSDYHRYCDRRSTPVYVPPDPRVLAFQRANQRFADLLKKWRDDFQFVSVDDWLNMDRSSESALLSAAGRLDQAFVDQINHFQDDMASDHVKVVMVAANERKIASYRHNIAALDRYLAEYGPPLAAATKELDRFAVQLQAFQTLSEEYRLKKERNQWLAVESLSVYLPKKAVTLDTDTVSHYRRLAPIPLDGSVFPFVDEKTPKLAVPPPWEKGEFDNRYQVAVAVPASLPKYSYKELPQTPEDAVAALEADEQRAAQAFRRRNDFDKANPEYVEYDRKEAEVAQLAEQQTEKMAALTRLLDQRKEIFPKLNAAKVNISTAAAVTINRAVESLIWEAAKNTVINKCKKVVADTANTEPTQLYLGDSEIFDKYKNHLFNIFNLPETVFKVKELRAVQNDILTLLKQDQNYAKTAVRLAVNGDQSEIKAFVDGMFSKLDEDSTKLVDDALAASSTMPEPVRTLASRYFTRSFREQPHD